MELLCELFGAGRTISELEKKRSLLRGLPPEYDVTSETIMSGTLSYHEAVSKLVVHETKMTSTELSGERTMLNLTKDMRKCYACGKVGRIARDCWSRRLSDSKKGNSKGPRGCYKCGKLGHTIQNYRSKNKIRSGSYENTPNIGALTSPKASSMISSVTKTEKWILYSGRTRHVRNCHENFKEFSEKEGVTQEGSNECIKSEGFGTVQVFATVKEKRPNIQLQYVLYVPDLMFNLISVAQGR